MIERVGLNDWRIRWADGSLSRRYGTQDLAIDGREAVIRQARARRRPCLTCGADMLSEGTHHRMCDRCRSGDAAERVR